MGRSLVVQFPCYTRLEYYVTCPPVCLFGSLLIHKLIFYHLVCFQTELAIPVLLNDYDIKVKVVFINKTNLNGSAKSHVI